MATENGSIVYFATEIKEEEVDKAKMDYSEYKKDIFTKEELITTLVKSMGQWIKRENLEAMFSWY